MPRPVTGGLADETPASPMIKISKETVSNRLEHLTGLEEFYYGDQNRLVSEQAIMALKQTLHRLRS